MLQAVKESLAKAIITKTSEDDLDNWATQAMLDGGIKELFTLTQKI
jgi:hypothetical protein